MAAADALDRRNSTTPLAVADARYRHSQRDADSLCRPPPDLFFYFLTSAPPFPFSLLLERGRRGYGEAYTSRRSN